MTRYFALFAILVILSTSFVLPSVVCSDDQTEIQKVRVTKITNESSAIEDAKNTAGSNITDAKFGFKYTQKFSELIASIPPDIVLIIVILPMIYLFSIKGVPQLLRVNNFTKRLTTTTVAIRSQEVLNWDEIGNSLPELKHLLHQFRQMITDFGSNTQSSEFILSEESILKALNVDDAALEHYPGMFTAFGIAGTFIGILFVLVKTGAKISPDSKGLIDNLLHGAGIAFLTSVIGIGFSITFLGIERRYIGRFKKRLYDFQMAMNNKLERITPEEILYDIKDAVETMADDIAAAVTKTIKTALEKLEGALDTSISKAGEGSQEIVDKVLSRIEDSLSKFQDNVSLLEASAVVQTDILQNFDRTVINASELADKFERLLPDLNTSLESMEVSSRRLEQLPQALSDLIDFQKEFGETIKDNVTVFMESWESEKERLTKLTEELNDRYSDFEEGIVKGLQITMSKFDDELSRAGTYIATWLDRLHQDISKFDESLGRFNSAVTSGSTVIEGNFRSLSEILQNHSEQLKSDTQSITSGLNIEFDKLKDSIASVPSALSDELKGFQSGISEIPKEIELAVSNIQNIYTEVTEKLPELLAKQMEDLVKEVEKTTKKGFAGRWFGR